MKILKDCLLKKKKTKKQKRPLRDPVTNEIFTFLLGKEKKKPERALCFSRFRVAIALLWSTGLRVNEIRNTTKEDMKTLLTVKKLSIYQEKVNAYRDVFFSDSAVSVFQMLKPEIELVFKDNRFLAGTLSNDNWIIFVNQRLKKHLDKFTFNIKSHSFRVNYVTQMLTKLPLQHVQKLIGHQEIKTTLLYDRDSTDVNQVKSVLDEIQNLKSKSKPEMSCYLTNVIH